MSTVESAFRAELDRLCELGDDMLTNLVKRHQGKRNPRGKEKQEDRLFETSYQEWYTLSSAVVRQLIPDRLQEFADMYTGAKQSKGLNRTEVFSISHWLLDLDSTWLFDDLTSFDRMAVTIARFRTQLEILKSAKTRLSSAVFSIRQMARAELLDSEIDEASELLVNGYVRAAGAVAGVVLEGHLADVCSARNITPSKRNPTIADFNDALKNAQVFDVAQWRFVQFLADVRNSCDHKKQQEPSADRVREMIAGVSKMIKTVS